MIGNNLRLYKTGCLTGMVTNQGTTVYTKCSIQGETKKKQGCCHKNFNMFLDILRIVPFNVLSLSTNALLHWILPPIESTQLTAI